MGTVKGDLHDIGKNLVGMMAEGAGFTIVDLGTDTSADEFIAGGERARRGNPGDERSSHDDDDLHEDRRRRGARKRPRRPDRRRRRPRHREIRHRDRRRRICRGRRERRRALQATSSPRARRPERDRVVAKLYIDNEEAPLLEGGTLFDCAEAVDVSVPTSCVKQGKCRECLLEIDGGRRLPFGADLSRKSTSEKASGSPAAPGSSAKASCAATRCAAARCASSTRRRTS